MGDYRNDAFATANPPTGNRQPKPDLDAGTPEPRDRSGCPSPGKPQGPRPPERGALSAGADSLPAVVELQSAELERLARDNQRLMDRIETFLQLQEREQVLRQQLQSQVDRLNERLDRTPAEADREAVRRAARETMNADLKPILLALLDVLERIAGRDIGAMLQAPQGPEAPAAIEEFRALPEFLTRPIDEPAAPETSAQDRPETAGKKPRFRGLFRRAESRPPDRTTRQQPAPPGAPSWTTIFS